MKCTFAIRQMAYEAVPDTLDEYLQMGATTARDSLRLFCKAIMELYGEEFLRKPTYTDMEKLYAYHEEKHGFPGMLGSIDYTDWSFVPSCFAILTLSLCSIMLYSILVLVFCDLSFVYGSLFALTDCAVPERVATFFEISWNAKMASNSIDKKPTDTKSVIVSSVPVNSIDDLNTAARN
ncbi:ALP1-like protein [Tanacetum coccineum]|uniref:ALP1-like protein n=1 Tax=Tanacetum coccineum TaxID=301880 RepID=A0ABQ5C4U4_9ASTR